MWGTDRFLTWEMRKVLKVLPEAKTQVFPTLLLHKEVALLQGSLIHLVPTMPGMRQPAG